ncbi:hypothetical protein JOD31_001505 [Methylopila capsulata]|uniref:NrS-1 polymerase-like helicase domain-containing protein n=1 Tax=Methylopila capsulata TaxID=61654 RepID=A0A9W6IQI3_9HYPH|nr:primase-helicase family protein [Methylopila capsulata]MBM7851280.1 hypothetical protein [Methylopila capsulata]GLK54338.1 hypothetical protein GCM10008170_03570 [Methylopila capsulata]
MNENGRPDDESGRPLIVSPRGYHPRDQSLGKQARKMSHHYTNFVHSSTLLTEGERFVAWRSEARDDKPTKVPYDPRTGRRAKSDDPATWGTREAAERRATMLLNGGRTGGIGVMLGDVGGGLYLCGVDLDSCLDGDTLAPWATDVVERFRTRAEISPSGRGLKLYFVVTSADREALGPRQRIAFSKPDHCEIALDLGGRYYALTDHHWVAELLVGALEGLRIVPLEDLRWLVHTAGPAFMGKASSAKDDTDSGVLYRLARRFKLSGRTFDDFLAAIEDDERAAAHVAKEGERAAERAWARVVDPRDPLDAFDDDEIAADIEAVVGKLPADPITARLNGRYALVRHAGRTLVAEFGRDRAPNLGTVDDLHRWSANDLVPTSDGKKMEPASLHWLRDPRRRQFSEIVFDPSGRASPRALNLWSGWAIEPDPAASCDLIVSHVREVLAGGDEERFRYIIGWLADMVQNPGSKPGVALVLKGGKGAGKDTLAVVMSRIVGRRHVAHIDNADRLTSRFNAPFASALLGHVEEAFWAGDRGKKGALQALITAPTMTLEKKGIDSVVVASFVRFVMTTNEDWAVPASHDERRYAVFDVSDCRIGDRTYFRDLYAQIEGDGAAAFLAHLLAVDLRGFSVRDAPQTEALRDQKLASLSGVNRWWFELLHDGALAGSEFDGPSWEDASIEVDRSALRASYEDFVRKNRFQGEAINSIQFGHALRAMLPSLGDKRPRVEGGRRRFYTLPALTQCRREFEAWFGDEPSWGTT